MKVSRFTILAAPPRWLFLQIETDKGVTGWGEPVDRRHPRRDFTTLLPGLNL
jgi:L-alanine-DL-glutamate epimerase-like enolase superfamily enzyme